MCTIVSVVNQKGGVGKTTTVVNLGIALYRQGKKVLVVDADSQGSLSISLGLCNPDKTNNSLTKLMENLVNDEKIVYNNYIIKTNEGIDLIFSNISLSGMDISLSAVNDREYIFKALFEPLKSEYDYILIDCMPSLGLITLNALSASDYVIIPLQASYLPVRGLEQIINTVSQCKICYNSNLSIAGILFTMIDQRTNLAKAMTSGVKEAYGNNVKIFDTQIPFSVKAAEASAYGKSIFSYEPGCKVAVAYSLFAKEFSESVE